VAGIRVTGIIAIIGAECSGKTSLAEALGPALAAQVVPEQLRRFVDRHGRVPTAAEQPAVLQQQIGAEAAAAAAGGWVVSDGGALMTAVYSLLYYDDDTLLAPAMAHHRQACAATLWCDIDVPWTPDAGQRDGPAFRLRAHRLIAEVLADAALQAVAVRGALEVRLQTALAAVRAVQR
jgi:nicotinamide riboside kinase